MLPVYLTVGLEALSVVTKRSRFQATVPVPNVEAGSLEHKPCLIVSEEGPSTSYQHIFLRLEIDH